MCQIEDTGCFGLCAWNFLFLKHTSIFLFFVSIFNILIREKRNWNKWFSWSNTGKNKKLLKS